MILNFVHHEVLIDNKNGDALQHPHFSLLELLFHFLNDTDFTSTIFPNCPSRAGAIVPVNSFVPAPLISLKPAFFSFCSIVALLSLSSTTSFTWAGMGLHAPAAALERRVTAQL